MIKSLRNNPILIHQMRHARWPSMRTAVWIAVGVTVIGLALTIGDYAISPGYGSYPSIASLIGLAGMLLVCLGPFVVAIVAVVTTVHIIDSEAFQKISSEREIVNSSIAAAVFRLRPLWMVAIGLVLPLIAATTHLGVAGAIFNSCQPDTLWLTAPDDCPPPPAASEIVMQQAIDSLFITTYYAALFLAAIWLAVTFGVWKAFHHRRVGKALDGALHQLVLIAVLQALVSLPVVNSNRPLVLFSLVSAGIDIGLGWLAYRQAVKCVRSASE